MAESDQRNSSCSHWLNGWKWSGHQSDCPAQIIICVICENLPGLKMMMIIIINYLYSIYTAITLGLKLPSGKIKLELRQPTVEFVGWVCWPANVFIFLTIILWIKARTNRKTQNSQFRMIICCFFSSLQKWQLETGAAWNSQSHSTKILTKVQCLCVWGKTAGNYWKG